MRDQLHLLKSRRFWPLFITQFLGAFNDNLFKNALVILIMYTSMSLAGITSGVLVVAAGGIFILPFFLFSATAGQLADKFEKSKIIRLVKVWEILVMILAALGFWLMDARLLMAALFLMGTQSTFFGPIKYSILPDHLERDELIAGNALVEAATFVAILLGTIAGGALIAVEGGVVVVSGVVIIMAVAGLVSSMFIPKAPAPQPQLNVGWNIVAESWKIIGYARESRAVFLSIIGISWFWLIGAVFLSTLPVYVKQVVGGSQAVVTWFLAMFSIGVGLGSLLCNKLLRGEIDTRFVPLGAFGMTLFGVDLCLASWGLAAPMSDQFISLGQFISTLAGWRLSVDLFMIAACGGLFIVPLYAVMQTRCSEEHRARIIAANNILNALFMVASAGGAAAMLGAGFTPVAVFLAVSLLNAGAYFVIRSLAVESGDRPVLRLLFTIVLKMMYRVRVRGVEHMAAAGKNVMIVANHQSFLDGVILPVFFPGKYSFVVNRFMASHWWARMFLSLVDTHTLDTDNPMAIKGLVKILRSGGRLIIFPEGRITVTGALMKIHEGPALLAQRAGATILPIRIDGAQVTHFSRMTEKIKPRLFPRITITALPPQKLRLPDGAHGRLGRKAAGERLSEIMTNMMYEGADCQRSVPKAVLDACGVFGARWPISMQAHATSEPYGRLIEKSARIGAMLGEKPGGDGFIGVMLPNSLQAMEAWLGALSAGKTAAMIDPGWAPDTKMQACHSAGIKRIIASHATMGEQMAQKLTEARIEVLFYEDMEANLYPGAVFSPGIDTDPGAAAVAFYHPEASLAGKWEVYSHSGMLAGVYQLAAVLDVGPADVVFCASPISCHAGLLTGALAPLILGAKSCMYPSSPEQKGASAMVYESNSTVVFGSAAQLAAMVDGARPYDFSGLRRVFAVGAKPSEEVERVWMERNGHRLLWIYSQPGAGMISANSAMRSRARTAGRLLPGVKVDTGSGLRVDNPGAAMGYIMSGAPGEAGSLQDGPDKIIVNGSLDEDRYLSITNNIE